MSTSRLRHALLFTLVIVASFGCGQSPEQDNVKRDGVETKPSTPSPDSSEKPAPEKPAPPAKPKPEFPTIWRAAELNKIIDFTMMALPDGAQGEVSQATVEAEGSGKIQEIADHYVNLLTATGWTIGNGPGERLIDDMHASVTARKQGVSVHLTVIPVSDKKMIRLMSYGCFDVADLPAPDRSMVLSQTRTHVTYVTESKVAEAATATSKKLAAEGWHLLSAIDSGSADQPRQTMEFMKHAYLLTASIDTAPAQNNKTAVSYSVHALSLEMPIPPKASNIKFDERAWSLECDTGEEYGKVVAFYQKEMLAAGYAPPKDPKIGERFTGLRFGTPGKDEIFLGIDLRDEKTTKVQLKGFPKITIKAEKPAKSSARN